MSILILGWIFGEVGQLALVFPPHPNYPTPVSFVATITRSTLRRALRLENEIPKWDLQRQTLVVN